MNKDKRRVVLSRRPQLSPAKWTMLVIAIGIVLGLVFVFLPRRAFRYDLLRALTDIDIVISTVALALAVALSYLYAKTYTETRAPFALGLLFVLSAVLFHEILTSPVFLAAFGALSFGVPFILPAHVFEAIALGVFLYLSLQ